MRIETFLIGMMMFGLVFTVGALLYADQTEKYNLPRNESLFSEKLQNITYNGQVIEEGSKQALLGQAISSDDSDSANTKTVYPTSLKMWDIGGLFGAALAEINSKLGIPQVFSVVFLAIIGIIVVAFIAYFIRGFKEPD